MVFMAKDLAVLLVFMLLIVCLTFFALFYPKGPYYQERMYSRARDYVDEDGYCLYLNDRLADNSILGCDICGNLDISFDREKKAVNINAAPPQMWEFARYCADDCGYSVSVVNDALTGSSVNWELNDNGVMIDYENRAVTVLKGECEKHGWRISS